VVVVHDVHRSQRLRFVLQRRKTRSDGPMRLISALCAPPSLTILCGRTLAEESFRRMKPEPIIADRGEFVDALNRLRRGHVLVKVGESSGGCVLDGSVLYRSYDPLLRYGLIDEFQNPYGFKYASYYRLTPRGKEFAERACQVWRRKPLWQRLAVRLAG